MRRFRSISLVLLLAAVFLCSIAFIAFAKQDGKDHDSKDGECIGEYVSEAAPKGSGAAIPPGHYGIIASYADVFLSNTDPSPHRTLYAEDLWDGIDDPNLADELYDFFLLDIRKSKDFVEKGHICGAVNIVFEEVAKPENLAILPTDMPILVICYTGHTASQINSILKMLGYNAWTLRFGMTSVFEVSKTKIWSPRIGTEQDIYGAILYGVSYPICK